jgi:predicted DNA-binding protein YlxM (UPF0122 family)
MIAGIVQKLSKLMNEVKQYIESNNSSLYNGLGNKLEEIAERMNVIKNELYDEMGRINKVQAMRQNSIIGLFEKNKDVFD